MNKKIVVSLFLLAVILSIPVYPFEWHLFLHVAGAVIFIGNIIVTGTWVYFADRTGDSGVLKFAIKTAAIADGFFTGPGVVMILLNGLAMATDRYGGWGEFHEVSWITTALGLFALSGVIWAAFLIRAQGSMVRIAESSGSDEITNEFRYQLKRWYFWGGVATVLPIVSLGLMIFKPALW